MARKDETFEELAKRVKKEADTITGNTSPMRDHYRSIDQYAAETQSPFREFNDALGRMREESTQQLYKHLQQQGTNGPNREYNGKKGSVTTKFGNVADVDISYSGLPGLFQRDLSGKDRPITLSANVTLKGRRENIERNFRLPQNTSEVDSSEFEDGVASYLHDVVSASLRGYASTLDGNFNPDALWAFPWFEGDLVIKTSEMLGSSGIIDKYLARKASNELDSRIEQEVAQLRKNTEPAQRELEEKVAQLRTKAGEVDKTLDDKMRGADAAAETHKTEVLRRLSELGGKINADLAQYESRQKRKVNDKLLKEAQKRRDELGKEADSLKKQIDERTTYLAQRKGELDPNRVYLADQLERVFPDYNPEGSQYDVNHGVRAQVAKKLSDRISRKENELNGEDVMALVGAISGVAQMSGHNSFNSQDLNGITGLAEKLMGKISPERVKSVVERISRIGNGGASRVSLDALERTIDHYLS